MDKIGIQVDGRIVEELSDRIPSNLLALNELLKNAYDAGASTVDIRLDTFEKTLTISDTGNGMSDEDIRSLFHLAHSTKRYGEINSETGRRVQGSKGLGFLSAFKFGNTVSWHTSLDGKMGKEFSVNIEDIKDLNDINEYALEINSVETEQKGTTVQINLNPYSLDSLSSVFANERYVKRILHCFYDGGINISLYIDGTQRLGNEPSIISKAPESALLYSVEFNSEDMEVQFFHKGVFLFSNIIDISSKGYSIEASLNVYQFVSHQGKQIDEIYRGPGDTLYPLIYINDSLFDNFDLFNPDILRSVKSGKSLPQITGRVCVNSDNMEMQFNSDRSKFQQNALTDSIAKTLDALNRVVQIEGSKYKNAILKGDYFKKRPESISPLITDDQIRDLLDDSIPFWNLIKIKRTTDGVCYSLLDSDQNIPFDSISTLQCAKIVFSATDSLFYVPSGRLNLLDFVESVIDSEGNEVSRESVEVHVDGALSENSILDPVFRPCEKLATFVFHDPATGMVTKDLKLIFKEKTENQSNNFKSPHDRKHINIHPLVNDYVLTFLDNVVLDLIDEINNLSLGEFPNVLTCSVRTVFELTRDSLRGSVIANPQALGKDIDKIIDIALEQDNLSRIAQSVPCEYKTLRNILRKMKGAVYPDSSLAVHKATHLTSVKEIESLFIYAGAFVTVANELKKLGIKDEQTQ